jgi:cytochrome c oxidase cbb3-type subunit II
MSNRFEKFWENLDLSALFTVIAIIVLFSFSVIVILIAPSYVDPTWTNPASSYQVQMYEISDPNYYLGSEYKGSSELQALYHLKEGFTLLGFQETDYQRIVAPKSLQDYVTKYGDPKLRLTTRLLLLRRIDPSMNEGTFNAVEEAEKLRKSLQEKWEKANPNWQKEGKVRQDYEMLELYVPGGNEAFSVASVDSTLENWVDKDYVILDKELKHPYQQHKGVIYIRNPVEYRVKKFTFGDESHWRYDPTGTPIKNMDELKSHPLTFRSRQEFIRNGEHIFAVEGCWYCHTDQTRTLIQDVVLNGSAAFPAPPSSANEYIYQKITFPGTKRNGPDLSRVGIKRPSRDWHRGHFWSPKTASQGSIMPAFKHFFDNDPRGVRASIDIPNYKFESVYQYLMTKGTRITPPTEAWWTGKDPINTKEIIEGKKIISNKIHSKE